METLSFYVDKQIVEVKLQWTNNKNMYLKLTKENEILVTAPQRISLKQVKIFVEQNIHKFVKHLEKAKDKKFYDLSENWAYVLGKKTKIQYMSGFETQMAKMSSGSLWLLTKTGSDKQNEKVLKEYLRSILLNLLEEKQPKWESKMKLQKHKIRVIEKSTSWGSNSLKTKSISYALMLSHFSEDVIDYLIVHELSHDYVPNHSSAFWEKVEEFLPGYKNIKRKLKVVNKMEE